MLRRVHNRGILQSRKSGVLVCKIEGGKGCSIPILRCIDASQLEAYSKAWTISRSPGRVGLPLNLSEARNATGAR